MKASEMTNERIAEELVSTITHLSDAALACTDADDILREAAARLRKQGEIIKMAHVETRIATQLRRRLKVAEDALEKLQERLVSSVHDGTIDPYEALKIADNALAAIREEGGANK